MHESVFEKTKWGFNFLNYTNVKFDLNKFQSLISFDSKIFIF